jgi:hypothetical protein
LAIPCCACWAASKLRTACINKVKKVKSLGLRRGFLF